MSVTKTCIFAWLYSLWCANVFIMAASVGHDSQMFVRRDMQHRRHQHQYFRRGHDSLRDHMAAADSLSDRNSKNMGYDTPENDRKKNENVMPTMDSNRQQQEYLKDILEEIFKDDREIENSKNKYDSEHPDISNKKRQNGPTVYVSSSENNERPSNSENMNSSVKKRTVIDLHQNASNSSYLKKLNGNQKVVPDNDGRIVFREDAKGDNASKNATLSKHPVTALKGSEGDTVSEVGNRNNFPVGCPAGKFYVGGECVDDE